MPYKPFVRISILAIFLVFAFNSHNCPPFEFGQTRFWLLDPATVNMKGLLPFTYEPYALRYPADYYYEEDDSEAGEDVPEQYRINSSEWAKACPGASETDIFTILYNTDPALYFQMEGSTKNSFLRTLNLPQNAALKAYLDFAKHCEQTLNADDPWEDKTAAANPIKPLLQNGAQLLQQSNNTFVQQRLAYQLIKLSAYAGANDKQTVDWYEKYLKPAADQTWVSNGALFYVADTQTDSLQRNLWLARAWAKDPEHQSLIERRFKNKLAEATLPLAKTADEKAAILLIPALSYPGPALDRMQRIYDINPAYPELSLLMAREINKLEDWLMSPKLGTFGAAHTEFPYDSVPPEAALIQKDLEHLHKCRQFVNIAIAYKKRPDPAFWLLTATHLAFLDQDFHNTANYAHQGLTLQIPPNQHIQFQLMETLALVGSAPALNDTLESKITECFDAIANAGPAFDEEGALYGQLAWALSDILIQKSEKAKGALLRCQTDRIWDFYGASSPKNGYDKLLNVGTPTDFDQAIAIIQNPKSPLEKWLANRPCSYRSWVEWKQEKKRFANYDDKVPDQWDINKFREFKSMCYMRRDQLDSAVLCMKALPQNTIDGKVPFWGDTFNYFYLNPFSVMLSPAGVDLAREDSSGLFNRISFVEKIIDLKKTAGGKKDAAQKACFLLGNAYYNMAEPGRNWFLMVHPYKGYGVGEALSGNWTLAAHEIPKWSANNAPPSQPRAPLSPVHLLFPGIGMFILLHKKRKSLAVLALMGLAVLSPLACVETPFVKAHPLSLDSATDVFGGASRAKYWYDKGLAMNPESDVGLACAYMASLCAQAADAQAFYSQEKSWEKTYTPAPDPYFKGVQGKTLKNAVSCSYFNNYLATGKQINSDD